MVKAMAPVKKYETKEKLMGQSMYAPTEAKLKRKGINECHEPGIPIPPCASSK
jgi:hypothetical protein